jgi:restriction system protein
MDIAFHFPPELMSLLVDTIPRLCRSKTDTILFLRGAGVANATLDDVSKIVQTNRDSITKFEIVRRVLTRLSERGEVTLRERREIVKRVVEYDDFSSCWEADRLMAQGLVSQIQKLVGVKDSFTRMRDAREKEQQAHRQKQEAIARNVQDQLARRAALKDELFSLFGETNASRRGKLLEAVMNRLFEAYGILVRQAFELKGDHGEGIVEQIDGVIEMSGHLYFVEIKWWKDPVGVPEIAQHMMRVFSRAETRAIIISASSFTEPAITTCKAHLNQKVVTFCTLEEIVLLLERQADVANYLKRKVDATIIEKTPLPNVAVG